MSVSSLDDVDALKGDFSLVSCDGGQDFWVPFWVGQSHEDIQKEWRDGKLDWVSLGLVMPNDNELFHAYIFSKDVHALETDVQGDGDLAGIVENRRHDFGEVYLFSLHVPSGLLSVLSAKDYIRALRPAGQNYNKDKILDVLELSA